MLYRFLSDLMVILHLAFILFVLFGGLLVLRFKKLVWLHIPAVIWGAIIEFFDWFCPLTPLEIFFRAMAGMETYKGDFVERYLLPLIYPDELTRNFQILLGLTVISLNIIIYSYLVVRVSGRKKY